MQETTGSASAPSLVAEIDQEIPPEAKTTLRDAAGSASAPSLARQIGHEIAPAAKAMLGDAVLFLLGLIILSASFLCLLGLQLLHYPVKYIAILESLHFWGYLAVLTVFLLDLVWKIAVHAFVRK
jgi:hypothetical protein